MRRSPAPSHQSEMQLFKKIRLWLNTIVTMSEPFPTPYRYVFRDEVWRQALLVLTSIINANQIKPLNQEEANRRLRLQNNALAALTILDSLMQVALEQKAVNPKKLANWATQTAEIRVMILGWIKADHRRRPG